MDKIIEFFETKAYFFKRLIRSAPFDFGYNYTFSIVEQNITNYKPIEINECHYSEFQKSKIVDLLIQYECTFDINNFIEAFIFDMTSNSIIVSKIDFNKDKIYKKFTGSELKDCSLDIAQITLNINSLERFMDCSNKICLPDV